MKIKNAIFDIDGTLLDSMGFWDSLGVDFIRSYNKEPKPDFQKKYYVLSQYETAGLLIDEYGIPLTRDQIIQMINESAKTFYFEKVQVKPHVIDYLETLKNAGVKLGAATATERYLVEKALDRLDMAKYFDFLCTCSEIDSSKTEPKIYLHVLDKLGGNVSESAVFEDALAAATCAKKAGFYTVGVYDKTGERVLNEMKKVCDEYVYDFSQISDLT